MNNKLLSCIVAGALGTSLALASPVFARGGGGGGMHGGMGGGMHSGGMHIGGMGGAHFSGSPFAGPAFAAAGFLPRFLKFPCPRVPPPLHPLAFAVSPLSHPAYNS